MTKSYSCLQAVAIWLTPSSCKQFRSIRDRRVLAVELPAHVAEKCDEPPRQRGKDAGGFGDHGNPERR